MGCGDAIGAICGLGCFLGISLVLQGAGLFSPRWATISITNTSSECYLGLVLSDCDDSTRESNRAVLGLQATSFAVILLTNIVSFINFLCCNNDDDDAEDSKGPCTVCLGCSVILYPIAGLFILIGCIIHATEFSTSQLGWGFYCCIAAGCYIIIETVCMCCILCIALRSDDDSPSTSTGQPDRTVAVTESSRDLSVDRRQSIRLAHVETELHTVATSTGFAIVARQVTRMIHLRAS